jgi:hypothetical protein
MINMKTKGSESPELVCDKSDKEHYPYGLCLSLGKEELAKLGITTLPAVGTEMTITAKSFVKSTSAYDEGGEKSMNVSLQITDMEIGAAQNKTEAATLLYGAES